MCAGSRGAGGRRPGVCLLPGSGPLMAGHPTLGAPEQRGVPGSRGASCSMRQALTADICSKGSSPPPTGPLSPCPHPEPPPPSHSVKKPGLGISRHARCVSAGLSGIVILHLFWFGPPPLIYTQYFCFFFFGNSRWQFEIMHPLFSSSGFGAHGPGFAGLELIRSTSVFKH